MKLAQHGAWMVWLAVGAAAWAQPTSGDVDPGRVRSWARRMSRSVAWLSGDDASGRSRGACRPARPTVATALVPTHRSVDLGMGAGTQPSRFEERPARRRAGESVYRADLSGGLGSVWARDIRRLVPNLIHDHTYILTPDNVLILALAGGASLAVRETIDDDVEEHYIYEHDTHHVRNRLGRWSDVFGGLGNPAFHLAGCALVYAASIQVEDAKLYTCTKSVFDALVINQVWTTVFKASAGSTRTPNGERWGWPSGHTSSTICIAAAVEEHYGFWWGLPWYAATALTAWGRLDDGEHDLSDIVFGAALGYVIGKSVARGHRLEVLGCEVLPYTDPTRGGVGVAMHRRF